MRTFQPVPPASLRAHQAFSFRKPLQTQVSSPLEPPRSAIRRRSEAARMVMVTLEPRWLRSYAGMKQGWGWTCVSCPPGPLPSDGGGSVLSRLLTVGQVCTLQPRVGSEPRAPARLWRHGCVLGWAQLIKTETSYSFTGYNPSPSFKPGWGHNLLQAARAALHPQETVVSPQPATVAHSSECLQAPAQGLAQWSTR